MRLIGSVPPVTATAAAATIIVASGIRNERWRSSSAAPRCRREGRLGGTPPGRRRRRWAASGARRRRGGRRGRVSPPGRRRSSAVASSSESRSSSMSSGLVDQGGAVTAARFGAVGPLGACHGASRRQVNSRHIVVQSRTIRVLGLAANGRLIRGAGAMKAGLRRGGGRRHRAVSVPRAAVQRRLLQTCPTRPAASAASPPALGRSSMDRVRRAGQLALFLVLALSAGDSALAPARRRHSTSRPLAAPSRGRRRRCSFRR